MTDNHIENAKPFARAMRAFFYIIKLIFRLILINICAEYAPKFKCVAYVGLVKKKLFENHEKNLKKL